MLNLTFVILKKPRQLTKKLPDQNLEYNYLTHFVFISEKHCIKNYQ